jgi:hypothetical protein
MRIFAHKDEAGQTAAERWMAQLMYTEGLTQTHRTAKLSVLATEVFTLRLTLWAEIACHEVMNLIRNSPLVSGLDSSPYLRCRWRDPIRYALAPTVDIVTRAVAKGRMRLILIDGYVAREVLLSGSNPRKAHRFVHDQRSRTMTDQHDDAAHVGRSSG